MGLCLCSCVKPLWGVSWAGALSFTSLPVLQSLTKILQLHGDQEFTLRQPENYWGLLRGQNLYLCENQVDFFFLISSCLVRSFLSWSRSRYKGDTHQTPLLFPALRMHCPPAKAPRATQDYCQEELGCSGPGYQHCRCHWNFALNPQQWKESMWFGANLSCIKVSCSK